MQTIPRNARKALRAAKRVQGYMQLATQAQQVHIVQQVQRAYRVAPKPVVWVNGVPYY